MFYLIITIMKTEVKTTAAQIKKRVISAFVPTFELTNEQEKLLEGLKALPVAYKGAFDSLCRDWNKAHESEIKAAKEMNYETFLSSISATAHKDLCNFLGVSSLPSTCILYEISGETVTSTEVTNGLDDIVEALLSGKEYNEFRFKAAAAATKSKDLYKSLLNKLATEIVNLNKSYLDVTKDLASAIEAAKIEQGKFEAKKKADKERLTKNLWYANECCLKSLHKALQYYTKAAENNKTVGKAKKAKLISDIKTYQNQRNTLKVLLSKEK